METLKLQLKMKLYHLDAENGILVLKGSIPGHNGARRISKDK